MAKIDKTPSFDPSTDADTDISVEEETSESTPISVIPDTSTEEPVYYESPAVNSWPVSATPSPGAVSDLPPDPDV